MKKTKGYLTGKNYLGFVLGCFGITLIGAVLSNFLSFYLTNSVYMNIAVVSVITSVATVVDAVTDLIMGGMQDNIKMKHGKARGWILYFSIPLAVFFILCFFVPSGAGNTTKVVYFVIVYFIFCLMNTLVSLPYNTLPGLMTNRPEERSKLFTVQMIFSMGGAILVSMVVVPMVTALGSWGAMALVFGVLGVAGLLIMVAFTRENVTESRNEIKVSKTHIVDANGNAVGILKQLSCVFRNKYWVMITAHAILTAFGFGFMMSTQTYYCTYILNDLSKVGLVFTACTIGQILGMVIGMPLISKYGKRNVCVVCGMLSLAGYGIILADVANFTLMLIGLLIRGFFWGPVSATTNAFYGDTIEYGEWKYGIRQDGLVFSVRSVITKIASAIAGAVLGFILAASGYDGALAVQTEAAIMTIKACFLYFPIAFYLLAVIILFFYDLDKKFPMIVAELEARKQTGSKEEREGN